MILFVVTFSLWCLFYWFLGWGLLFVVWLVWLLRLIGFACVICRLLVFWSFGIVIVGYYWCWNGVVMLFVCACCLDCYLLVGLICLWLVVDSVCYWWLLLSCLLLCLILFCWFGLEVRFVICCLVSCCSLGCCVVYCCLLVAGWFWGCFGVSGLFRFCLVLSFPCGGMGIGWFCYLVCLLF